MISVALAILKTDAQRNEMSVFYEKNKNRFLSIALKILHNEETAEDTVQDAFLKIADKPNTFFSLSDTQRILYLCAVVKNASVDKYNKRKKVQIEPLTDDLVYQDDPKLLENTLFNNISHKELIEFISGLPELQRNVLVMTRLLKLSISETAQHLGVSEKAVNQRLYLARKAIKQFIDERKNRNE